jgi:hypothetical protein
MERLQLNVRTDPGLLRKVDQKRLFLTAELGYIPTRSEIVRMALDQFLAGIEVPKAPARKKILRKV